MPGPPTSPLPSSQPGMPIGAPSTSGGLARADGSSGGRDSGFAALLWKAGAVGTFFGLGIMSCRYARFRRRCLAMQRPLDAERPEQQQINGGPVCCGQPGGSPGVAGVVEGALAAPLGSEQGSLGVPEDGLLRKGSAELAMLGGFVRESWMAFSSGSRGGSRGGSRSGSSSTSGSGGRSRSGGSAASTSCGGGGCGGPLGPCFDSAGSCERGGGSGGSGELFSTPSLMMTDVTKLPDTWNIVEFHELDMAKAIGEGSFGQVYLAKYCQTTVAVKVLNAVRELNATSSMVERSTLRHLSKEAGIMVNLRHPNVTQYLGVCLDPPCLLMEYCSRRSVDAILKSACQDPKLARQLSWARLLGMAFDAAKGMLYLHSRHPPIVHRDLKSANLLVDNGWHVKVADFNLSKAMEVNGIASTVFITNPRWLAPEVIQGGQAQLASDVWAFGTVMWELMTWQLPFEKMNPFQIIVTVTNAKDAGLPIPPPHALPAGPMSCYAQYVDLMRACWARDPANRPTMDAVVTALLPIVSSEMRRASTSSGAGTSRANASSGALALGGVPSLAVLHGSRAPEVHTPKGSEILQDAPACAFGASGDSSAFTAPSSEPSVGSAAGGSPPAVPPASPTHFEAALAREEHRRQATEELLAAGHCTVANAGQSQLDSGTRGYPFVNPKGFFSMLRGELKE